MFRFPLYNFSLIFAVINLLHDPFHTLLRNNSIEMEKGGEAKGRERWMRRMMNREREREREIERERKERESERWI